MRPMTRVILGIAVLAILGGGFIWYKNRSFGAPTAQQWERLKTYQMVTAAADSMACPPEMVSGEMHLDVAEEKFLHLKARYTLSPDQVSELSVLATKSRAVSSGTADAANCGKMQELVEHAIGEMDHE